MTTLTTHDTKRGEDVRARIGVLSQVPSLWTEFLARWEIAAPSPDVATGQFLWQNIFGVWPASGQVSDELRGRLHAYAEKAIREASWHTSWNDPDAAFEDAIHRWVDTVLDGPVAGQLTELVAQLNSHAASDALGQKLLALTVPGIPDIYQGTELWDDSLVDPDNRRPVDYAARRAALTELQHPKTPGRHHGASAAPQQSGQLFCTAHMFRCWPPGTPVTMSLRSVAATTSWSR